MTYNLTDIEDFITMNNNAGLQAFFVQAQDALNNGDIVILQRFYENAEPDIAHVMRTTNELMDFSTRVTDAMGAIQARKEQLLERIRSTFRL